MKRKTSEEFRRAPTEKKAGKEARKETAGESGPKAKQEEPATAGAGPDPLPPDETVTIPREEWQNTVDRAAAAAEQREDFLRLAAELDNFRKRTEKEKARLETYAEARLLNRLLPALDNIEHALSAPPGQQPAGESGLLMILRELRKTILALGLSPLELKGKAFDPLSAEAVEVVETGRREEDGVVLDILRQGYAYRDTVLRPAMVRIGRYAPGAEKKGQAGTPGEKPAAENGPGAEKAEG